MDAFNLRLTLTSVLVPLITLLIVFGAMCFKTWKEARVAEKAIEAGTDPDAIEELSHIMRKRGRRRSSAKKSLLRRIVWGTLFAVCGLSIIIADLAMATYPKAMIVILGAFALALGLGLIISYIAGRKLLAHEIELEERAADAEFKARLEKMARKGETELPE